MSDRLGALDASFLHLETPTTAMHVGSVATFAVPAGGTGYYPRLVQQISDRIGAVPRSRQKLRRVPGGFAHPVWVDDPDFDVGNHVRHSVLPPPGSDAQLRELAARIQSRHLDRGRPWWELHVVHGLSDNRFALITKIHHATVDGIGGLDISRLLFDPAPTAPTAPPIPTQAGPPIPNQDAPPSPNQDAPPSPIPAVPPSPIPAVPPMQAVPAHAPSPRRLVAEAVLDLARRPATALAALPRNWAATRTATANALRRVGGVCVATRTLLRPAPGSPLNTTIGTPRRYTTASTRLDDYQRVRQAHGVTINDVVLATVSGALRGWLHQRGKPVPPTASLRAMVPVNVGAEQRADPPGKNVSAYVVELPIGEPDPLRRLGEVCDRLQRHNNAGPSGPTDALITLASLVPPPLHTRGARLVGELGRRLFNVVVSNVPGPQLPLYVAGARMLTLHPVVPLAPGQAVSIGLISYDGDVFYGLNADRDSMPDLDRLAALIEESLQELVDTVPRPAHPDVHNPGAAPRLAGPEATGPV